MVTFRLTSAKGTKIVTDPSWKGPGPPRAARGGAVKDLSDADMVFVTHAGPGPFFPDVEVMKASRATLYCPPDVAIKVRKAGIPEERVFSMVPGVRFGSGIWHQGPAGFAYLYVRHEGHWLTGCPSVSYWISGRKRRSFSAATTPWDRIIVFMATPITRIWESWIGGISTNGQCLTELYPDEAAVAAKWLGVQAVIPMHYLDHEDQELSKELEKSAPEITLAVMKPGERLRFSRSSGITRSNQRK